MSIVNSLIQTSDLYYYITSNQLNLNIKTLVGSTLYDAKYRKRVIIAPGVTIGSNSTSTAALIIPTTTTGGEIVVDNYGSIQGAGGAANSGTGGDAILAQAISRIINRTGATIYSGGGGGGRGGTGGTGGAGSVTTTTLWSCSFGCWGLGCCGSAGCYCGSGQQVYTCCNPSNGQFDYYCYGCYQDLTSTSGTSGGAGGGGGNGGRGRGYDGALASGSSGAAGSAGGTNAGTGGTGGTGGSGGDWGASGSGGSTGGTGSNGNAGSGLAGSAGLSGGLAGYYINGLSTYVTLTNNGTVAGRTN